MEAAGEPANPAARNRAPGQAGSCVLRVLPAVLGFALTLAACRPSFPFDPATDHVEVGLHVWDGTGAPPTGFAVVPLRCDDRADFVIVRGNPLEDVANLREIVGVWVGGVRVEGAPGRP